MEKPTKKLFLLDAMALIYRAHFAFSKNPRITTKKLNTGAVFGFTNTMLDIINKEKPTHLAVALDTAAPTFRHIEYVEYKAQRQEQPEDISVAIPYVKKIVEAFDIPLLVLDGFEADDIIGTIAKKAARNGFEVFMMTPDKDYGQLVEDHIYLYKPAFMGNGVDIMGVKEVLEKWQIKRIDQVVDMLGLMGDKVDNIPGIPGVGEKTAQQLLEQYDSVEGIIAHKDELKGKLKEKVEQYSELAILSKRLATINLNVPVEFNEEKLIYTGPTKEKVLPIFDELEFRTLTKRVFGEDLSSKPVAKPAKPALQGQMDLFGAPEPVVADLDSSLRGTKQSDNEVNTKSDGLLHSVSAKGTDRRNDEEENTAKETFYTSLHDYRLVNTPELQKSLVEYLALQKEFCFDTETTSVEAIDAELVGLSFAYIEKEAYYVPVNKENANDVLAIFKPVFENPEIRKIGQNIKYDMHILANYGIELKGELFDTMLAHYLIEPDMRHGMDALSEAYLNYSPISIETLIGKKGKNQGNMADVEIEIAKDYACEDADITLRLKNVFEPIIKKNQLEKVLYGIETPLIEVLKGMEKEGINLDVAVLKDFSKELEKDIAVVEQSIYDDAGEQFNIASPKQLGEILFDKLKIAEKPKKTATGQYATGEEILVKLANTSPIVNKILDFRELVKLKNTYVDTLPEQLNAKDNRVHTSFLQTVAATGRLSSQNPNLQNIPIRTERGREIRKAFVARNENYQIISADYSQIELRIMASFCKDESMIEAFRNGRDIHATTAAKVFKVDLNDVTSEMRRKAKVVNFAIIYGISAFGLSERLNIPRRESAEIIEQYFQEFPAIKKYMDDTIHLAREQEYVETIFGRRRYLRDINSRNQNMRGFAERNAINAPIQGSAADIIKIAMINIHKWLKEEKLQTKMVLQVHDELLFDTPKEEIDYVKPKIEHLMKHAVELDVPMEIGLGVGNNWLEAH
jgi:DNA polymerase I